MEQARRTFWQGVWRIVDPKISLASIAGMFLGAAVAASMGPLSWGWLALTVLGILSIEAAKNASGEIVDDDSGTDRAVLPEDRSPFSGGKRVLVDHLMTRRQTGVLAAALYAAGAVAGLAIVLAREPRVLGLGVAGVALAFCYHAPPLKLSYRGLGELAVAVAYGPLVTVGTYLVQRNELSWPVVLLSLPLGLLVASFLWINEFPDARADAGAGKRTLVVRLGRPRASTVFTIVVVTAFTIAAALGAAGSPRGAWLGLAGLPLAVAAARRLRRSPESTPAIVPAQAWTLLSFLLYAAGAGIGTLLS